MAFTFHGPIPTTTNAYHVDASGNEYFGECAKESDTTRARWAIFKKVNTASSYGTPPINNWIILFPIDPTKGVAVSEPKFIWDNVESYNYACLGCPSWASVS